MDVDLGDSMIAVVWKRDSNYDHPLAHPVRRELETGDKRIEVIDGVVDSVVKLRIEKVEADRLLGRVFENFTPDSEEWEEAQEIIRTEYDFETEVVEQGGQRRTCIRTDEDYQKQWEKQKSETFDRTPNRP